jgi:hypothetical protein
MTDGPDRTDRPASPLAGAGGLVRATLELDGATLTLLPRRAPVGNSGPIRGRPLTVFPLAGSGPGGATGPGVTGGPDEATLLARLRAALPRSDAAVIPAVLQPGDAAGVAVFDLSPEEAVATARALTVVSILHWDGRRAHLLP